MLSRRECLATLAAVPGVAAAAKRPNVLLIMSDDQGWGDLSSHGNPDLKTPEMDRLASQGTELTRFYVSPVCAPTRSSLLTGRYNVRCGVHGVTWGMETMATDETTIAEALRPAGYRTALIGKWHLGEHYPYVPHGQGFDEFIGFRTGHWNKYFDTQLERNGKPYPTKGFITDALTDEAIRFLEQKRRDPFFLYLAYNAPHSPYQAPERNWRRFHDKGMPMELSAIYGMVENLDANIGRLLGRLDALGLAQDTIVIFLTDNGPNGKRYTSGLRGQKGAVYEGGVRAPFFIRWPGRVKAGGKVETIAAHIDVYPTVLDLCGVPPPKGRPIDGRSLRPLLEGRASGWPDRAIFTHRETAKRPEAMYPGAVRTQRFNLVDGTELYEIPTDPGEQHDVSARYPEKVRELRALYEDWFQTAIAERGFHRYPIPVGYDEENPVVLPAPQSYFSGSIKFHNDSGFAHDWLTAWTQLEDRIHWELDVVRGGAYDIGVRYLCPAGATGSVVELSMGGKTAEAKVAEATDMSPAPNHNLVPVKHYNNMRWGTLRFGHVEVPRGRTRLELRARSKPGPAVMDVKEAVLRRL
ncbi:MAG: arylsulfatase [Acidobacteria bacterium]|nr:arylsulfatase [Acidobacteriota bacterium]